MRGASFKAAFRQAPPRSNTPPPPAYEPLSPVLAPSAPAVTHPAGGNHRHTRYSNGDIDGAIPQKSAKGEGARVHVPLSAPAVTYEPPPRSAPLSRPKSEYSPALGSPIEALADAAASSLHTSPAYIEPLRYPSHPPVSPATAVALPSGERALKHPSSTSTSYPYNERPAKRARSEFFPSPQYGLHYSRPATSHIPGWSYNVEQMADNGVRMYQDAAPSAPQYHDENNLKRLSDAQLLMDFAVSASNTASPPAPSVKRWSISHPEQPDFHLSPMIETSSPYIGASYSHLGRSQYVQQSMDRKYAPELPTNMPDKSTSSSIQTHTPPEETLGTALPLLSLRHGATGIEDPKPKKHQGWPKGRPRGPRNGPVGGKKKRSTPKPKAVPSATSTTSNTLEQLHSPQSLLADQQEVAQPDGATPILEPSQTLPPHNNNTSHTRRHSFSNIVHGPQSNCISVQSLRAQSVPLDASMTITPPAEDFRTVTQDTTTAANQDPICAGCHSSDSQTLIGEGEQWISCDGCKEWYHFVCAGFQSEREVRDVDKFYCVPCRPKFGDTTKVRKSARAHTAVDYAGLNEGILKTSDDNPEHHYIAAFKNSNIDFTPETFARLPPELISADYLEKTNGFKDPIIIPASLNPRPKFPGRQYLESPQSPSHSGDAYTHQDEHYGYEVVPDDGQDKLDMVIPEGLTVRRVSELYGPLETVPVIDVKAQEGEEKKWTMSKWADYYEQQGEKPVRNVISLEVSRSRLGKLIRRPKAVRDLDLQDSVWPEEDKLPPPPVQFYCLMSVADCYTDFHIDFGGSSVYYHIVKGKKVFFFIPPTKQNLKKYEDWCLSPRQGHEFLGQQVKECYRVDLYPGDTMLIPSGWIHAVWTPEDSLVIGGNFLTRMHYGMQIKIWEIEKATKVALKFRYPHFQKIMWLSILRYLEDDPLPREVEQLLINGDKFQRTVPIYCETDHFGHNSHLGAQNYNRRYYSKAELEGLPDLLNYIWRTVLISLGRIEVPQTVRNSVTRSIPKGKGEPTVLARSFATWVAWKRGNETIPGWAYPEAPLPDAADAGGEKKLSTAQLKRLERDSLNDALRERHSVRIKSIEPTISNSINGVSQGVAAPSTPLTGFLRPAADPSRHMSTPKTSQLGPKRIACDACRKRRIRCKHKDEIIETSKPGNGMSTGMSTIDLSGSLGISVKRRLSEVDGTHGLHTSTAETASVMNGGPLLADANGDPYALKSGRVKACADCRKSKRRCIHDEYGNVDPVKANEVPIPRGSASKKRRISEEDSGSGSQKSRRESFMNGTMVNGESRMPNSLSTAFSAGRSTALQDIAYSAQQALDKASVEELMPIDPALQDYYNETDTIHVATPRQPHYVDTVVSSIEDLPDGHVPMEDVIETGTSRREPQGPTVEPLTPGPTYHTQLNGVKLDPDPSSPLSFSAQSNISPLVDHSTDFTVPTTPNISRAAVPKSSVTRKTSRTPRPTSSSRMSNTPRSTPGVRRRDSKESMKIERMNMEQKEKFYASAGEADEDMASLALALKLQMEEHGLRRRSK